jgi:3-hydroxy-9,10-secoandrosta-1,3,5(10)-triene-9,17-dione monooxygenase reductase component
MSLPPIEQQLFRRVCGKYATGITVVTILDANAAPQGMTANSFTSVSLDPPLVLFCIDLRTAFLNHFVPGAWYAINVLDEEQQEMSTCFARTGLDRFQGIAWTAGVNGAPILAGVLASLECSVTQMVEAGDHVVVIGQVLHATWREGQPLVYFNSSYQSLRTESSAS